MNEPVIMPKTLTAENGAKKLLIGEFKESITLDCDLCAGNEAIEENESCPLCGGAEEYTISVPVKWTTIKAIYAKAVEHFQLPLSEDI